MKKTNRVVLITGDSSGFGLEMVKLFIANGDRVYGLAKNPFKLEGLVHFVCDISDPEQCKKVVEEVAKIEGRIDVLINNAGFGISGAVEDTSVETAKKIFDVNFFGAFYMAKYALAHMKEHGGKIINTSSIASEISLPFQAFYSSTKCAMDTLFSGLRQEVFGYNISVTAVMPGDSKTGFTKNRIKNKSSDAYKEVCEKSVKTMEHDETHGLEPIHVAKAVLKVSKKKHPPYKKRVGAKDRFLIFLFKILPKRLANVFVRMIYASK